MKNPESIFLRVFGSSPINRVLDFLIVYEDFDYPMTEIAEKSGVGYSTLKLFWGQMVASGVVRFTRDIGNARLYKLNKESIVVRQLKKLYWATTEQVTEKMLAVTVPIKC